MYRLASIVFCILFVFGFVGAVYGAERLGKVTVEAGRYDRVDTPVSVSLDGVMIGPWDGELTLVERGRTSLPAQVEAGSPPRLWFVLAGKTKAGTKRTFSLERAAGAKRPGVIVNETDKHLDLVCRGDKVLRYNNAIVPPPEGQSKLYERSGFIHPLWSTKGTVLTNIHPADHIHHLGIWSPWTHTTFEGKQVDFWNLKAGQGTVRFKRFLSSRAGACGAADGGRREGCSERGMGHSRVQRRRVGKGLLDLGFRLDPAVRGG